MARKIMLAGFGSAQRMMAVITSENVEPQQPARTDEGDLHAAIRQLGGQRQARRPAADDSRVGRTSLRVKAAQHRGYLRLFMIRLARLWPSTRFKCRLRKICGTSQGCLQAIRNSPTA